MILKGVYGYFANDKRKYDDNKFRFPKGSAIGDDNLNTPLNCLVINLTNAMCGNIELYNNILIGFYSKGLTVSLKNGAIKQYNLSFYDDVLRTGTPFFEISPFKLDSVFNFGLRHTPLGTRVMKDLVRLDFSFKEMGYFSKVLLSLYDSGLSVNLSYCGENKEFNLTFTKKGLNFDLEKNKIPECILINDENISEDAFLEGQ
ncbi:Uncharacterised protein [Candidatus Tiddalikarchaeum anstoanum]|nr:Uncharacterised protein [Candidatus Tiddalikarchaeum anstoanum]